MVPSILDLLMHTITCTTITFRFGISRFTPRQNPKREVIRTEISGRTIQITNETSLG